MGFKPRIFNEAFVLSVVFILSTINVVSGCSLIGPDGTEVNLDDLPPNSPLYIGLGEISDNEVPRVLYTCKTDGITSFDPVPGEDSKYLTSNFDAETLEIFLSESYKDWEKTEGTDFSLFLIVRLQPNCGPGVTVEFRAQITKFTNEYEPTFSQPSYDISLRVPLSAGSTIVGECGVAAIEATDSDYNNQYTSNVEFVLSEGVEKLEVSSKKIDGKKWAVSLTTTETFRIEEPLTFVLTAYDIAPEATEFALSSEVQITITPDLEASTPASPRFSEPIHILDIKDGEDTIGPIMATLVEGASAESDVELQYSHGEHLEGFFDADISGNTVSVTPKESFSGAELSGNFGVLILVVTHRGTERRGSTVIHVTLPGNYATPPPTSTTEAFICTTEPTTVCPPCTTEAVTDCPVQTPCPNVTFTTEEIFPCTCPTEVTTQCPEVTTQCPEVTTQCPEVTTQCPEVTSQCPEVTTQCPEVTTQSEECTPCSDEDTTNTASSSTSGTTEACICTTEVTSFPCENITTVASTANTYPSEPCDCTSVTAESSAGTTDAVTNDTTEPTTNTECTTYDSSSVTTDTTGSSEGFCMAPEECTPCAEITTLTPCGEVTGTTEAVTNDTIEPTTSTECTPCDCSSVATDTTQTTAGSSEGVPGGSTATEESTPYAQSTTTLAPCGDITAPPEKKWVHFRDPDAAASVYSQQTGYIKTMSAFCSHDCTIVYHIEDGPLSDSLLIDPESGRINVTENISEGGQFHVTALAEIEGDTYYETARVHLNVMTLQPCNNGSQWTYSIAVKRIQEGLNVPYTLEKCDFGNLCRCTLENIIPEKAKEYFIIGEEVILNNVIDREDVDLFPDQSNTDIILQLEVNCESDTGISMSSDLRNISSQSAIDQIGSIEYNALRTVIVLKIGDENDNRPEFSTITSPLTVGYPNAEITRQLLPPFLTQVQATDSDLEENAKIKYSVSQTDQFAIHEETGVIYPVAGAFKYEDTRFGVHASDAEGEGEPLEVNVRILNHDNLLVIKVAESVLEDTDAILQKISSVTEFNIKSLSAAVIATDDDTGDRQLGNFKSTRNSGGSLLQLVVYGLNSREELVPSSDIIRQLDGQPEFKAEFFTGVGNSGDGDGSSDVGLLPAVIALSVILALLLGGAVVVYVLYIRPKRRNENPDYYDRFLTSNASSSSSSSGENGVLPTIHEKSNPSNPLANVQFSSATGENGVLPTIHEKSNPSNPLANVQFSSATNETEPSPLASPVLPRVTTTEPDKEFSNCTVLGDFDHGATDEFRNTSDEDISENEEEQDDKTRRKSVVTFNDNVERIEIERV